MPHNEHNLQGIRKIKIEKTQDLLSTIENHFIQITGVCVMRLLIDWLFHAKIWS